MSRETTENGCAGWPSAWDGGENPQIFRPDADPADRWVDARAGLEAPKPDWARQPLDEIAPLNLPVRP